MANLNRCLPNLWNLASLYGRTRNIEPELYLSHRHHDKFMVKALKYLFDYVKEIDEEGISAALRERLENCWRCYGSNETRKVYQKLGIILRSDNFGCSLGLWTNMENFLASHCARIIRVSRLGWIPYVTTLQDINASRARDEKIMRMTNVLSCIIEHAAIEVNMVRRLKDSSLNRQTLQILHKLVTARENRERKARLFAYQRGRHNGAYDHLPHLGYHNQGLEWPDYDPDPSDTDSLGDYEPRFLGAIEDENIVPHYNHHRHHDGLNYMPQFGSSNQSVISY